MSDNDLRELERHAASGAPGARERWLRARVRAGKLRPERLKLAAYCGDPGAVLAEPELATPEGLVAWCLGFAMWGQHTFARALIAALSATLARWDHAESRAAAQGVVDILEDWVSDPSETHEANVRRVLETQLVPTLGETFALRSNPRMWQVAEVAQEAARCALPDWVPFAVIPLEVRGEELQDLEAALLRRGAWAQVEDGVRGPTLKLADCGPMGAAGVTRLLSRAVSGITGELLAGVRHVRGRSTPFRFAAEVVGQDQLRSVIAAPLIDWALGAPRG